MKQFYKKISLRNRREMVNFLMNHSRYNTMNSWNNSTSYACNIKIYNLGLDASIRDKLYSLIETDEFWDSARELFDDFGQQHHYLWQVGTNGRSGGYLVLYQGFTKPSEHKSYCTHCGQKNFTSITENSNICGRCHTPSRVDYKKIPMSIGTYPGKSTDMHEDFEDWSMYDLRERVKLIMEFDKLADSLISLAVQMCKDYSIEDETYYIPKTRKVLVAAN